MYVDTNARANRVFSTQIESFVSQKFVIVMYFLIYLRIFK